MKKLALLIWAAALMAVGMIVFSMSGEDVKANQNSSSDGMALLKQFKRISGKDIVKGYFFPDAAEKKVVFLNGDRESFVLPSSPVAEQLPTAQNIFKAGVVKPNAVGLEGGGRSTQSTLNISISPVNQDCWTLDFENLVQFGPEGEWYNFPTATGEPIVFVDKIKIPRDGLPDGFALDHLLWKCRPIVNKPYETVTIPALLIDDIYFGPIENPDLFPREILVFWEVPASYIAQLGTEIHIDWAVGKEYHADLLPDTDGNGLPDVFLELPPLHLAFVEPDECGANLINFLMGNSGGALVVEAPFDAVPALPPRVPLPGMVSGEDGETRPWCFFLGQ